MDYFNATVLRKNITRFAPLWGLYTVFTFMFLLLVWEGQESAAYFANQASSIMALMGVVNFIYGGLCALVLYGDLFQSRMCNMLHALPLRREGWFLTHTLSGLLMCIVPNVLGGLVAAVLLKTYAYMAFLWLGLVILQFLFFFGVGSFCALCAGSRLGAVAMYTVTNFLSVLGYWLAQTFYEPLLYGVTLNANTITRLSPVVRFSDEEFIQTHYDNMQEVTILDGIPASPWIFAGVAAGVGLVLLVLALLIYRRRAMESAGDLISLRPVAPVLLVIYTLCVGALLYFLAGEFSGKLGYLFLFLGIAIGFFTGRMLLERRVQVFRGKNLLAFGILVVVFAASMGIVKADPIGITRYIPAEGQITRVVVSPYHTEYSMEQGCVLTAPEDIADIRKLHADAIKHPAALGEDRIPLHLSYTLNNGTVVNRNYSIPESLGYTDAVQAYYSRPICVLRTDGVNVLMEHLEHLEFYAYNTDQLPNIFISRDQEYDYRLEEKFGSTVACIHQVEEGSFADNTVVKRLLEAVYADCLAGTMSQWNNQSPSVGSLQLQRRIGQYHEYIHITVYESSENTLACLQALAEEAK